MKIKKKQIRNIKKRSEWRSMEKRNGGKEKKKKKQCLIKKLRRVPIKQKFVIVQWLSSLMLNNNDLGSIHANRKILNNFK